MTRFYKNAWWRNAIPIAGYAVAGLAMLNIVPALADPPDHAPAHGYRRKEERKEDHRHQKGRHHRDDTPDDSAFWKDRQEQAKRRAEWRREQEKERAEYRREQAKREAERRREWAKRRAESERERDRNDRWPTRPDRVTLTREKDRRGQDRDKNDIAWAGRDSDDDGIRNGRDRYPHDPNRH